MIEFFMGIRRLVKLIAKSTGSTFIIYEKSIILSFIIF